MKVRIYKPVPALQEFVLTISTVEAELPVGMDEVVNPYPPTPFQSFVFYCGDPVAMKREDDTLFQAQPDTVLIGPQYSRVNICVKRRLRAIRVDFLPGGLFRLLGVPMHALFDEGYNALDFFSADMKEINEQLYHIDDLARGQRIVEQFLLKKASGMKELLPFDHALLQLLHSDGQLSIEQTASLSCLSTKQFERKCQERIGMNPKMYARILRFSKAYRMHEAAPELSWIKIAHAAGYFDQMHMIRDFKVFAGVNPSVIEQELLATPLRMQKDLHY